MTIAAPIDPNLARLLREVEAVEAKIVRAKALADRLRRLSVDASRRADTRRKIILGGRLLAAARTEPALADLIARLVADIERAADRKPFVGFTVTDLVETAALTADVPRRRPRRAKPKPE